MTAGLCQCTEGPCHRGRGEDLPLLDGPKRGKSRLHLICDLGVSWHTRRNTEVARAPGERQSQIAELMGLYKPLLRDLGGTVSRRPSLLVVKPFGVPRKHLADQFVPAAGRRFLLDRLLRRPLRLAGCGGA